MGHRALAFLFLLGLSFPILAQEHETNNCHDPTAWAEWEEKAAQYPYDTEFQKLHALWKRLCGKVETGELSFEDAMSVFERAREQVIEHRRKEQRTRQSPASQ